MVTTTNSETLLHPESDVRQAQRYSPPEVRSLLDAVMDAVLDWQVNNRNRTGIRIRLGAF